MSPDPLRLLIADDEPLARDLLRQYVRAIPGLEVACECASGDDVARELSRARLDVALLDIQMPGVDVFAVLSRAAAVRRLPAVIFSTAYDTYAVRAFEMNAVDYLVKPYPE